MKNRLLLLTIIFLGNLFRLEAGMADADRYEGYRERMLEAEDQSARIKREELELCSFEGEIKDYSDSKMLYENIFKARNSSAILEEGTPKIHNPKNCLYKKQTLAGFRGNVLAEIVIFKTFTTWKGESAFSQLSYCKKISPLEKDKPRDSTYECGDLASSD